MPINQLVWHGHLQCEYLISDELVSNEIGPRHVAIWKICHFPFVYLPILTELASLPWKKNPYFSYCTSGNIFFLKISIPISSHHRWRFGPHEIFYLWWQFQDSNSKIPAKAVKRWEKKCSNWPEVDLHINKWLLMKSTF